MKVDLGNVPCAGFSSDEIDFTALHARLSQPTRDLLEIMINSAVTAESDPGAGRFCTIVVSGHSDRVDTAGLTSEARRAQELNASQLRAESALAFFFNEIFNRLQSQGFTAPVDLASMRNVDTQTVACGAADLEHLVPSGEEERKDNRRVQFIGTSFVPG